MKISEIESNKEDIIIMRSDQRFQIGRVGKALIDHFTELFAPGDSILFCVNDDLIEALCAELGVPVDLFNRSVLHAFSNGILDDEYCSVAIAGFQVSIAYDNLVRTKSSYNQPLMEMLNCNYQALKSIYSAYQDRIWFDTERCFKKNNLYLLVPEPRKNPYRYVQYPYSQKIVEQNDLMKWKEKFAKISLKPDSALSFSQFSDRVFQDEKIYLRSHFLQDHPTINPSIYNIIAMRVIFSFYLAWDGKQQEKRRQSKAKALEIKASTKEVVFIRVSNETFCCLDRDGTEILAQRVLAKGKKYFEYDPQYKIWRNIPKVVSNDCIGIILHTDWLGNLLKGNPEIGYSIYECYVQGTYSFIVLSENLPKQISNLFGIYLGSPGFVQLCGGLKNSQGDYIQGVLPTVLIDGKCEKIFIDSEVHTITYNRLDLNTVPLTLGYHSIKAKGTGVIGFTITSDKYEEQETQYGWTYEWQKAPLVSSAFVDCVFHGLLFNTMAFPNHVMRNSNPIIKDNCITRNQELLIRPYSNSLKIHLARGRYSNGL